MSLSRLRLLQNLPIRRPCHSKTLPPIHIALRFFSISPNKPRNFTFTYLRETLGFSERNAEQASEFVDFRSPENPDRFVSVMKGYGFTQTQISDIARRIPALLITETEKTVVPVLDHFRSLGFSDLNFTKMVVVFPGLMKLSLDDQIRPGYEFFRSLFQSDEKAMSAIRRWPHVLIPEFRKIAANVAILREFGVPNSHIATLVENKPKSMAEGSEKYRKVVRDVSEKGYDPAKINFVLAVYVGSSAGRASERKEMAGLDFLVNQPCLSGKLPVVLGASMKKKVIPRCSILHTLLTNKSMKPEEVRLRNILRVSEKKFMMKYIRPFNDYKDTTPDLMKMYREKKKGEREGRFFGRSGRN